MKKVKGSGSQLKCQQKVPKHKSGFVLNVVHVAIARHPGAEGPGSLVGRTKTHVCVCVCGVCACARTCMRAWARVLYVCLFLRGHPFVCLVLKKENSDQARAGPWLSLLPACHKDVFA